MNTLSSLLLASSLCLPVFALERITIGTGALTGTYYPTGAAICRMLNKLSFKKQIRCSVETTQGSVYNINTIKSTEFDFAIAQSDIVYKAAQGIGSFKNKKVNNLRSVMAIYPELLTLIARKDAKINKLFDIKNKRINIGNKGSGTEGTVLSLLKASKIQKKQLKHAGALNAVAMPDALRDKKIDAYFYMVGHPNANIKIATDSSTSNIVALNNNIVDALVKKYPYYAKAYIPAGIYKNNTKRIPTFGVKAVLVTNSEVNEKIVYELVKVILENFEEFKQLHPVYSNISKKSLLDGLSSPLHKGAKKYFQENNLL